MLIYVFSDTHGDTSGMDLVISKLKPDMIIHCGDGMDDAIEISKKYPDIKTCIVRGNCDDNPAVENQAMLQLKGHTLYITHGDQFNHGKGLGLTISGENSEIAAYAKQQGATIVLHGHTHQATYFCDDGVSVMNPGSASMKKPYDYKPSFGCIELYENKAVFKLLSIEVLEKF